MTAARIRRGPAPKARASAGRGKGKQTSGWAELVPIPPVWRERLARWAILGTALAVVLALLVIFQVPRLLLEGAGELAGRAGLAVRHVEVTGIARMDPRPVSAIALSQRSTAMPLVDLDAIRDELMGIGWVEDARVSRRMPDTLAIRIVERVPAAIWQNRRRLSLIDANGVVLGPVALDAMPDLPRVIGPAANRQAAALGRLLDDAPTTRPMLAGATWVGGRRWDLRFRSGEVLALPEGEAASRAALVRFAREDAEVGLLGQGLVRFDMRIPGRMTVRVTREPGKRIDLAPDDAATKT